MNPMQINRGTMHNMKALRVGALVLLTVLMVAPHACGIDLIFSRTLRASAGGFEGATAFGDINGDGDLDIVYARQTDEWGPPNPAGGAAADPADFQITWRENDGTDSWPVGANITYTAPTIPNYYYNSNPTTPGNTFNGNDELTDVAVADVDGDTHNDIVCSTLVDGIFWFRNQTPYNGTSWAAAQRVYYRDGSYLNYPNVRQVFPGDVDNDGDLDIMGAISESGNSAGSPNSNSKLSVFYKDAGVFTEKVVAIDPEVQFIISVHMADLVDDPGTTNDDGKPELIVSTLDNDVIRWYRNNGGTNNTISFTGYLVTNGETDPWDVCAGDFDADGDLDIVAVAEGGDRIRWFENNGSLTANFGTARTIDTRPGGDPHYVRAIDMDVDGDDDVVATFFSTDEVVYYESNGASPPTWTAHVVANSSSPTPADDGPENLHVGVAQQLGSDDFYVDLVVGNVNTNTISFYKNMTYNYGPTVTSLSMISDRQIVVNFSMAMNTADATNPANYTVSGPGQGTLSAHPISVTQMSTSSYRLNWPTPQEMVNGVNVTVTAADGMRENDGAAPADVPIHEPKSATAPGRGTPPTVSAVAVQSPLSIDVAFTEAMGAGVTTPGNYTLSGPGQGTLAANPDNVVYQGGNVYRLTWSTGEMRNGALITVTVSNVEDAAGNPIGSPNSGSDQGIGTAPTCDIITPTTSSPTNSSTVSFAVGFSENVQNFNAAGDLVFTEVGVTHTGVTIEDGPRDYNVHVTGVSGDGSISITVNTASDVQDLAGNPLASSVTSAAVVVDNIAPNATQINSLTPSPIGAPSFSVHFDEDVQNFNLESDLVITETGTVGHTGVDITGGPQDYTVDITGVTGLGTMTLAASTGSDVQDLATNALASSVTSAVVQIDAVPPNAVNIYSTTPSPTSSSTVSFTVQFDKPVYQFNYETDLVIGEVGLTHTNAVVNGNPGDQDYSVQITGLAGDGSVTLAISTTSDVRDAAYNGLGSSVTSDPVLVDNLGPNATTIWTTNPDPTNSSTVVFKVQFDEDVLGFDLENDLVIEETGDVVHTGATVADGPNLFTVYLTGVTGNGTVTLAASTGTDVRDTLGNPIVSSVTSDPLTIDVTPPNATSIVTTNPNPTNSSTVNYTVGFDEAVQNFNNAGDLVINVTGTVTYGGVASFGGGPQTYSVDITGVSGDGTITLAVDTFSDVEDLAGTALASSVTSAPLTIDMTDPTVTVDTLVTKETKPLLSGSVDDNVEVAGVQVTIPGQGTYAATLSPGAWGLPWPTDLAEGNYDVQTLATDTAGNTANDTTLNELTVDLTNPTITVTPQITSNTTPIVSGTVNDNVEVATVTFWVNGYLYDADVVGNAWSGQVTNALPSVWAQYDVQTTATDTAGNTGSDATTDELTIDPNAPSVFVNSLTTSDNTPQLSGSAGWAGAASDIVSVDVTVHGHIYSASLLPPVGQTRGWTADVTDVLPDGTYDVVAVAMDDLARSGTDGSTNELTVDTMAPTAVITLLDPTPTDLDSVDIEVAFNEPVAPTFSDADVTLTGTLAGAATFIVTGTDPTYVVAVTPDDAEADGTLGIVVGIQVTDPALNPYAGGSSALYHIHNWRGFTAQPQGGRRYEGESHSFAVATDHGNSTPVYQWKWDDNVSKMIHDVGGNSPVYDVADVAGKAGDYWCDVTYDGIVYTSNTPALEVAPILEITQHPAGDNKEPGEAHTFVVVAQGGFAPLAYEWWKDTFRISGATDASYAIPSLQTSDTGAYYCVVRDDETAVLASNTAILSVGTGMPVGGLAALGLLAGACLVLGGALLSRKK